MKTSSLVSLSSCHSRSRWKSFLSERSETEGEQRDIVTVFNINLCFFHLPTVAHLLSLLSSFVSLVGTGGLEMEKLPPGIFCIGGGGWRGQHLVYWCITLSLWWFLFWPRCPVEESPTSPSEFYAGCSENVILSTKL